MDINEFFNQSAGQWFSQRSSHYLDSPKLEAGTTDLWIDILPATDPEVIQLCEQNQIDPSLALLGARVKWNGTVGTDQRKQTGTTLLIPLTNPDNLKTGQLLSKASHQNTPAKGHYTLGEDDVLTLITETPRTQIEERLWFENPNFRLRTSTVKTATGYSVASLCSEIRRMNNG